MTEKALRRNRVWSKCIRLLDRRGRQECRPGKQECLRYVKRCILDIPPGRQPHRIVLRTGERQFGQFRIDLDR
jgi:hypothetical protein